MEKKTLVIETSKTKTFTLGKDSIIDLVRFLSEHSKTLKQAPDWEWNNLQAINKLDSYISLLKVTPWNEGGYCQDDLD